LKPAAGWLKRRRNLIDIYRYPARPFLRMSAFAALAWIAAGLLSPASAAPTARLVVDRKGTLRIPKATLKALSAKQETNGMVCVDLPFLKPPKLKSPDPHHPETGAPQASPKLWVPLAHDGTLIITRTLMYPPNTYVPGPPGTVYLATGKKGCVVLQRK